MEKKLFLNDLNKWMRYNCDPIDRFVSVMAKMYLPHDYVLNFERDVDDRSYCSLGIKDKRIGIHVGMYHFLVNYDGNDNMFITEELAKALQEDHDRIVGNLGREFTEDDFYAIYMASAIHEFMHACITRHEEVLERLVKKFPMRKKNPTQIEKKIYEDHVRKFLLDIFNCVEDARIENIAKNLYNVEDYLNYLNEMFYLQDDGTLDKNIISEFTISLKYQGVLGVYPQTPIDDDAVEAIEAIINKKVNGSTKTRNLLLEFMCEPGPRTSICMFERWFVPEWPDLPKGKNRNKFYEYVEKIIYEELEENAADISNEIQQYLNQVQSPVSIQGGTGGIGKSNPNGILINLPDSMKPMNPNLGGNGSKSENSNSGSSSGNSGKAGNNLGKDGAGSSAGNDSGKDAGSSGNDSGKDESKDKGGDGDGKSADNASNDSKSKLTNGSTESLSNGSASKNASAFSEANHSSNRDNSSEANETDTFDKNGKWNTADPNLHAGINSEKLAEIDSIRKSLDEAIGKIRKQNESKRKNESRRIKRMREHAQKTVESGEWIVDTSFKPTRTAPKNIVTMAQPLRKAIRKLFHDSEEDDIRNLRSGQIDDTAIYKFFGLGETEVFEKHIEDESKDSVYYILWDGSGSMCGEKQTKSGIACAVIEEAIRGLFPLKIVNFSHDYTRGSVHYVVKNFSDNSRYNSAYSFAACRSFNGCNRDSDAIDMATKELIQRSEQKKYMFVLSDGAPSAYSAGTEEGVKAVKEAVGIARKNHINVIAIFFGSDKELESQIDHYKTMYGQSVIACSPDQIAGQLVSEIKKTIF